jgi:hypothetical protein
MAWEDKLDTAAREQVAHAVRDGVPIADASLEPFVYGLIARRRRQNRWRVAQVAVALVFSSLWIYVTTVVRPSPFRWFWIVTFALAVAALPLVIRAEQRRLDKAEAAQTSPRG